MRDRSCGRVREFPGRHTYNADRACEKSMGVGAIMEMDLPSNKARRMGTGIREERQEGTRGERVV